MSKAGWAYTCLGCGKDIPHTEKWSSITHPETEIPLSVDNRGWIAHNNFDCMFQMLLQYYKHPALDDRLFQLALEAATINELNARAEQENGTSG